MEQQNKIADKPYREKIKKINKIWGIFEERDPIPNSLKFMYFNVP